MPNNKGRVPGSGKNTKVQWTKWKKSDLGEVRNVKNHRQVAANTKGAEGPKKSSPRNSAKATKKMANRGR